MEKKFKEGVKVLVAQCYLEDEVSEPHRSEMSETATVCSEPTDDEELVSIQYESGLLDFVPQDILEVIQKVFVRIGFSDLILPKEDIDKSICVIDEQGQPFYVNTYTVGYELEDGTECDEEGNKL